MESLEIFDKPMCCSTGVCGPQVDPVLPRFAADLGWLKNNGVEVHRYNLAHQPDAFAKATDVAAAIAAVGTDCLPIVRVNGIITSRGIYPSREQLAQACGVPGSKSLPIVKTACCDGPGSGCC